MSFRFDSLGSKTREYRGKTVKVSFTNGNEEVYKVVGFTSGLDNGDGMSTLEVRRDNFRGIISIDECDIASIELME